MVEAHKVCDLDSMDKQHLRIPRIARGSRGIFDHTPNLLFDPVLCLDTVLIFQVDDVHDEVNDGLGLQPVVGSYPIRFFSNFDENSLEVAYHGFPLGVALATACSCRVIEYACWGACVRPVGCGESFQIGVDAVFPGDVLRVSGKGMGAFELSPDDPLQ